MKTLSIACVLVAIAISSPFCLAGSISGETIPTKMRGTLKGAFVDIVNFFGPREEETDYQSLCSDNYSTKAVLAHLNCELSVCYGASGTDSPMEGKRYDNCTTKCFEKSAKKLKITKPKCLELYKKQATPDISGNKSINPLSGVCVNALNDPQVMQAWTGQAMLAIQSDPACSADITKCKFLDVLAKAALKAKFGDELCNGVVSEWLANMNVWASICDNVAFGGQKAYEECDKLVYRSTVVLVKYTGSNMNGFTDPIRNEFYVSYLTEKGMTD
eukprot:453383_1